jgi:hypothetical protein
MKADCFSKNGKAVCIENNPSLYCSMFDIDEHCKHKPEQIIVGSVPRYRKLHQPERNIESRKFIWLISSYFYQTFHLPMSYNHLLRQDTNGSLKVRVIEI